MRIHNVYNEKNGPDDPDGFVIENEGRYWLTLNTICADKTRFVIDGCPNLNGGAWIYTVVLKHSPEGGSQSTDCDFVRSAARSHIEKGVITISQPPTYYRKEYMYLVTNVPITVD